MKKLLAVLMAAVFCISLLAGCGQKTGTTSDTNAVTDTSAGAASSQPSQEASTVKEEEPAKPITITFMRTGTRATDKQDFILETLPQLVKEKFPNITVEATKLPDDQYKTSLKTKLAAGEGPDIFSWWPAMEFKPMIDAGYVMDVSDLSFLSKFNKSTTDAFSQDGKVYGVPQSVNPLGMYYNKSMFSAAGITAVPQDWPSFLDACKRLKDAGIAPIISADKDSWVVQFGMYQVAANIVYPDNMDFDSKLYTGETSFSDPKWVETIDRYKKLYDEGYVIKNSLGIGSAQAAQLFVDGKGAMIWDGNWDYNALTKKGAADFERGFFPLPANDPGKPLMLSAAPSDGYCINSNSQYAGEIKQIMEYWYDGSSPLFQAWADDNASTGGFPAYSGLTLNTPEFQDFFKLYQTNQSVYFCNQAWPAGLNDVMQSKFQEIIAKRKTTASDVAKAMDDKFEELTKNK